MVDKLALVIDQGTHATRTMGVDREGRIRAGSYADVSLSRLNDTHVEQDGVAILATVNQTVSTVLAAARSRGFHITCAGLATQRSSVVAWDRETGNVLSPVISWQDRRVGPWPERLQGRADEVQGHSGLPLSPHYGAGKLKWLLDHLPAVRAARDRGALAWGPLASFLLFHLLRRSPCLVDHANAQRTQLWNLSTREWDPWLLELFQLSPESLPVCRPVCADYGRLVAADIPMTAVSGDQTAAFLSLGRPGTATALVNLGTGAFILTPTGATPVFHPRLLSGLAASSDQEAQYVLEGTVNGAGAALVWARDTWGTPKPDAPLSAWLSREADVPLFINAVGGIGSPWWRPHATSSLVGDGAPWQRAVAVLESILFLIQANLDTMVAAGCGIGQLHVTGGLARLDGLCQRLSDLSRMPVYRPAETEATVRGAAWLAFGCPRRWPRPGRGRWFRPRENQSLMDRYRRFHEVLGPP